jgi:hypothetical protein
MIVLLAGLLAIPSEYLEAAADLEHNLHAGTCRMLDRVGE